MSEGGKTTESQSIEFDVAVVGAGNAALTAAISAADAGARVVVLEKASFEERGGNSRFTGGLLRFAHGGIDDILSLVPELTESEKSVIKISPYPPDAFFEDIVRLSRGLSDPRLVGVLTENSYDTVVWLKELGLRFDLYGKYVEKDGYKMWPDHALLVVCEGGEGVIDQLSEVAAARNIEVRYDSAVTDIVLDPDGAVAGVEMRSSGSLCHVRAPAVVLASGGFEASGEMRARYLGGSWDLAKVRGTKFNTGEVLMSALSRGAQSFGQWSDAHAVPVDAFAPDVGDLSFGALTTRTSYPLGVMVNADGDRFVDEGSDFKLYTYAAIGRVILEQPGGIAYQIFDQRTVNLLESRYSLNHTPDYESSRTARAATFRSDHVTIPTTANTFEELARLLGIDEDRLSRTLNEFNASVSDEEFDPAVLDGKRTQGINPPKSNWALPLEQPPFVAYPVSCGITFTYGGLRINERGQVLDVADRPIHGLYATGEITGGFFYHNYPAGSGLMRGAVFGRICGVHAAAHALSRVLAAAATP